MSAKMLTDMSPKVKLFKSIRRQVMYYISVSDESKQTFIKDQPARW